MAIRFKHWFYFRWVHVLRCLRCCGYVIGFDTGGYHSLSDGRVGKNLIILRVYMSSSVHIDSKGSDILFLGKGPTQELSHTLTAQTQYSVNLKRPGINFFKN